MGGETELSTAIPCGEYNSRPSTRFGLPDSGTSMDWPMARAGTGFRMTCGKPAVAPNNVRNKTEVCLIFIESSKGGATRRALSLKDTRHGPFATLGVEPYHSSQAAGFRCRLSEYNTAGLGDAARPATGPFRPGFPHPVRLCRRHGRGRRRHRPHPLVRADAAGPRGHCRPWHRVSRPGTQYSAGIFAPGAGNPDTGGRLQLADVGGAGAHGPGTPLWRGAGIDSASSRSGSHVACC